MSQYKDKNQQTSFDQYHQMESQQMEDQCMFCSETNLQYCIEISVMNKHNQNENFEVKLIDRIIEGDPQSAIHKKFKNAIDETCDQKLTRYYKKDENKGQLRNLIEFYKFRKFLPRFVPNRQSIIAQTYYFQRLKLYYNQIKRGLNITVDPSSQFTDFSSSQSITLTKNIYEQNILEKLQITMNLEQTTGPTLQNYKTESKALLDLVHFLKTYPKIDQIPSFGIESMSKQNKKTSKQIFRDFINQKKTKKQNINKNQNKIFITFFSKTNSNSIPKLTSKSPLKLLKSQNLTKIKSPNKNLQILSKLQRIKNGIINQKVKEIIKSKTKQEEKSTPNKLKTLKKEQSKNIKPQITQKIVVQNLYEDKKFLFKGQYKTLSKLKEKRSQSETKIKSGTFSKENTKELKSASNKTINKFLNEQKISLEKQSLKIQINPKKLDNQRPLSQRKSLDLTKLKFFIKESQNLKLQSLEKKEDYLTQKYQNLVFKTPKKFPKTTNITPINSGRIKEEVNQIILQKNDNIVSMKKKKLELLKKNIMQQKLQIK